MTAIDRRCMLQALFGGLATAGLGASLLTTAAEATPMAVEKGLADKAEGLVQQAQMGPPRRGPRRRGPPPRRFPPRRMMRRRRVCFWRRGRRVCVWR